MSGVTEGRVLCDTTKDTERAGEECGISLGMFSPSQLGIRLLLVPTEQQEQLFSLGKEAVKQQGGSETLCSVCLGSSPLHSHCTPGD